MAPQSKIRLLVADGHKVLRNGVKAMLAGTGVKVVGEAASGQAAVKYAIGTRRGRRAPGCPHDRRGQPDRLGPHQAGQAGLGGPDVPATTYVAQANSRVFHEPPARYFLPERSLHAPVSSSTIATSKIGFCPRIQLSQSRRIAQCLELVVCWPH